MTSNEPTLNERLDRAILAYGELARLDPERWHDRELLDELNQSRDLDPSGLTSFMMLAGLLEGFTRETTFSAAEILADTDGFARRMAHIRQVKDSVEHPDAVRLITVFKEQLSSLARSIGLPFDAVREVLDDAGFLGYLRRDALRSMARLQPFQFTRGQNAEERLRLNGTVFEFWNINSLLSLLTRQHLAGVTLCLIRDPDEVMASYFVLAIKNGDNIVILTDRESGPHPAYWRMSRRPERGLERRARKNWFPYALLDFEEERGEGERLVAKSRTALVRMQQKLAPLRKVSELEAGEIVWLMLMYAQIEQRYGQETTRHAELAYTGEMVVRPEALVGPAGALVRDGHYRPLQVAPLTGSDVSAASTAAQWEREASGHNEWMIERYAHQVPNSVLNPVGEEAARALETAHAKLLGRSEESRAVGAWQRPGERPAFESLSPVTFGDAETLERDRLWVARMNQCRVVQSLAEREFEDTKEETLAWYAARLSERKAVLVEAAARGELVLPTLRRPMGFARGMRKQRENVLRLVVGVKNWADMREFRSAVSLRALSIGAGDERARFGYRCAVDETKAANTFAAIRPDNAEAVAELLGLSLEDLPFALRHWARDTPYVGNSILDRLDPSDWVLKNPWNALVLDVLVPLSKSAYSRERKRLGLS